jgi:hypothetical protein
MEILHEHDKRNSRGKMRSRPLRPPARFHARNWVLHSITVPARFDEEIMSRPSGVHEKPQIGALLEAGKL